MIRVIPGRIESNHIIPAVPLPDSNQVRSVSILLELAEPSAVSTGNSVLEKWFGILKQDGNLEEQYKCFLEEKHR